MQTIFRPCTTVLFIALSCLTFQAYAMNSYSTKVQGFTVYHSVFPSTFLNPSVAHHIDQIRDPDIGVLSVSVNHEATATQGLKAEPIKGTVRNLLGTVTPLSFRQIIDDGANYYLSDFTISTGDLLTFSLDIATVKPTDNTKGNFKGLSHDRLDITFTYRP